MLLESLAFLFLLVDAFNASVADVLLRVNFAGALCGVLYGDLGRHLLPRRLLVVAVTDELLGVAHRCTVRNCLARVDHLLECRSLLLLDAETLEVAPLREDLHGLDVLDRRQIVAVIFVAAQTVEAH